MEIDYYRIDNNIYNNNIFNFSNNNNIINLLIKILYNTYLYFVLLKNQEFHLIIILINYLKFI